MMQYPANTNPGEVGPEEIVWESSGVDAVITDFVCESGNDDSEGPLPEESVRESSGVDAVITDFVCESGNDDSEDPVTVADGKGSIPAEPYSSGVDTPAPQPGLTGPVLADAGHVVPCSPALTQMNGGFVVLHEDCVGADYCLELA